MVGVRVHTPAMDFKGRENEILFVVFNNQCIYSLDRRCLAAVDDNYEGDNDTQVDEDTTNSNSLFLSHSLSLSLFSPSVPPSFLGLADLRGPIVSVPYEESDRLSRRLVSKVPKLPARKASGGG